jgi:hypothetical protein
MAITRKTLSLAWLESENACNIEALRKYFADRGIDRETEIEITPQSIARAFDAGILSSNWLARRILTGEEKEEYEREMNKAMKTFEETMAPVLMAIIRRNQTYDR